MNKISIIMPVYNGGVYLSESIESILKQSYDNFELLIVDDGSTDNSLEVVESYRDNRIKIYHNDHNLVGALNKGLDRASGDYIARMDADDIMHVDRLKVQLSIMEEVSEITVCSTWMIPFGDKIKPGTLSKGTNGMIQTPLIQFILGNPIFHPTTMIRRDFLLEHKLWYENYYCAEDYKLWVEIAKRKGKFYVESQPLLYYRISRNQISQLKQREQENTTAKIKREILEYIVNQNCIEYPQIISIYKNMLSLEEMNFMSHAEICKFYYLLFVGNKSKLVGI